MINLRLIEKDIETEEDRCVYKKLQTHPLPYPSHIYMLAEPPEEDKPIVIKKICVATWLFRFGVLKAPAHIVQEEPEDEKT